MRRWGFWVGSVISTAIPYVALREVCLASRLLGHASPQWGERVTGLGRSFAGALRPVGSVGQVLQIALWSPGAWTLFAGHAAFTLSACRLRASMPEALFLLGVGAMGVLIPSAPGNRGTLEGAYVLALQLLGVRDHTARASFALTAHVPE